MTLQNGMEFDGSGRNGTARTSRRNHWGILSNGAYRLGFWKVRQEGSNPGASTDILYDSKVLRLRFVRCATSMPAATPPGPLNSGLA